MLQEHASFDNFGSGQDMHMCVSISLPTSFKELWIPLLVHEALLLGLALYNAIESMRTHGVRGSMNRITIFLLIWALGGHFRDYDPALLSDGSGASSGVRKTGLQAHAQAQAPSRATIDSTDDYNMPTGSIMLMPLKNVSPYVRTSFRSKMI
ncbi:hypothetical protein DFH11DRAFT_648760 [Phellopilus nigrolimitatus]|nr:hypothetical protein DFH11DRAFT_648760 [Phellopilus nigrolimitatus]